jgi:hypothetical protein
MSKPKDSVTVARGRFTYLGGNLHFHATKIHWTAMLNTAYGGKLGTLQFVPDPPKPKPSRRRDK